MPEQWAVEIADKWKAARDKFQRELDALWASGHDEDSIFVVFTSRNIDGINKALADAAEDYGIEP